MTSPFHFPTELYGEIAQHLGAPDKVNLCLTSKSLYSFVLPFVYSTLELHGNACLSRVRFLIAHPHLSRFVRELVLKPNYMKSGSIRKYLSVEIELARGMELLAPNLPSLERLVWDGSEIPDDYLWLALRKSCASLRDIGVNLGTKPVDPRSELFQFDDLLHFSLSSQVRDDDYSPNVQLSQSEKLPAEFWDMLINRSPRLRGLTLGHRGVSHHSRRTLDITPITRARWSSLSTLTLQNCRLDDTSEQGERYSNLNAFSDFIVAHQSIKYLQIQGLPVLGYRDILKQLKRLGCPVSLGAVPFAINTTIEELILTDEAYNGIGFHAFWDYVASLPSLKKLSLWMDFSSDVSDVGTEYNHIEELRGLVSRCPKLEALTVMCSTKGKETFRMGDFSQVIEGSSHLKSIELWKCHKAGDEAPAQVAEQLFHEHTGLEAIVVRSVHGYRRRRSDSLRIMQTGSYRVCRATDGKPENIFVDEKGGKWLPWAVTARKIEHELDQKTVGKRRWLVGCLWDGIRGRGSVLKLYGGAMRW
ncbi:hypothetical protein Moror_3844 [Moniliophthora roreri MCA 2997]|uniref:F-box domain-containing protein n=1 Tax=Moniliophthora roreri (strain MCA 2997) TaxID=1381753 RepID=V2XRC2_MONRO|nr:hypothetical protein Moror_3844 [Moniliophthora roreri MCA 2997]